MEFYKEIDIKSWHTIQQYCLNKWNQHVGKHVLTMSFTGEELTYLGSLLESDIKEALDVNVRIKTAIMFINPPNFVQDLHVDGFDSKRLNASNSALNLPILNCEHGPMMWYNGEYSLSNSTIERIKYLKITWAPPGPTVACTKIINSPTLVKINVPHNIENQSDSPRIMLSVRFNPDIRLG